VEGGPNPRSKEKKNEKGWEKETDDGQLVSTVVVLLPMPDINDGERRLGVVVVGVAGEIKTEEKSTTKGRRFKKQKIKNNNFKMILFNL